MKTASLLMLVVVAAAVIPERSEAKEKLMVVSVATEKISGYERFVRSLTQFGYEYKVFGLGEKWKGGDVANSMGGGQKINILKRELEKYNTDPELVVLFTDGYDVILTEEPEDVLNKFRSMKARVVFGAETFCWPDQSLIDAYPQVEKNQKRFLNSGGFIGYIDEIFELLGSGSIKDDEDDQLYYTKLFLNKPTRDKLNIKLDVDSEIFLNLNGAQSEIEIVESVNKEHYRVFNTLSDTYPSVIHGNGPSKLILNRLGNYIAKAYSKKEGCLICNENTIKLPENTADWPEVTIGVFVEVATPFLREFFEKLAKLNYPRNKISLLVHNNVKYHSKQVESFLNDPKNEYYSVKYIAPEDDAPEHEARSEALQECIKNKCKYYLSIDSTSHIDNPHTLKLLIEQNRPILAPIMTRPGTTWSNVWGAVNEQGFYARSDDYLDIVNRKLVGVWNVPYINEVILVRSDAIKTPLVFEDPFLDPIMSFNKKLRDSNVFMYATNRHIFGHLIDPDNFNTSLPRPEVYEITSNLEDWTARYIRPDYFKFLSGEEKPLEPCPDVFWFPVVTDEFCDDLITTVETHGGWSGGNNNNKDTRIPGGYENVPTVDIHMTQVGFQEGWLKLLKSFIMPIQQKIFIGYYHDPPEAMLNFVVRYRPGEQDHLRPHHDASTYTMNIALNKPDIDFEGGGCRFVRYNCSVTKTVKGWAMIHPGRLTHYHEGLKVTGGTRYIMVSFIDP